MAKDIPPQSPSISIPPLPAQIGVDRNDRQASRYGLYSLRNITRFFWYTHAMQRGNSMVYVTTVAASRTERVQFLFPFPMLSPKKCDLHFQFPSTAERTSGLAQRIISTAMQ